MYEAYVRKILQEYCDKMNYTTATRFINFYFEAQKELNNHRYELVSLVSKIAEYSLIHVDELINSTTPKAKRGRAIFIIHCKLTTEYSNREIGEIVKRSHSQIHIIFKRHILNPNKEYNKFIDYLKT